MKRNFVGLLILCAVTSPALADDKPFRFGVQTSLNSSTIDDPAGKTAMGNALSLSGIATFDIDRESRAMLNINKDSYNLSGSQTNVGQDVSSFGGGLSYQKMLRLTRTWKPWIGAGLGYTSTTYSNRYMITPQATGRYLYSDRKATDTEFLLNTNSEWQYNRDWDYGLQAQFAKSFSEKSSTLRIGVYVLY